jgi:hypothetical protein
MTYSKNPFDEEEEEHIEENASNKIFFVAILRNDEILVKYCQLLGNYDAVLAQIIPKFERKNGIKMTFNYEQ